MIVNELCQNSYFSYMGQSHTIYITQNRKNEKITGCNGFALVISTFLYLIFKVFTAVWTMKKYYVQNIKHLDLFVVEKFLMRIPCCQFDDIFVLIKRFLLIVRRIFKGH